MTDEGAYIIMEKTYKIEVDCANCAATIERHVAKLKCVKEVTVSYMAQKMLVEYAPGVPPLPSPSRRWTYRP